jgi:serine protease Do
MMNGIVIRLAGVAQPTTRIFHQEVITIGTAADCDVNFPAGNSGLLTESLILTLRLRNGAYRISTLDPASEVTRDSEMVAIGDAIQDGDTLYFGTTGIRLRFFALTSVPHDALLFEAVALATAANQPANMANAAHDRRALPRTDVAIVFVKELLRELAAEIPKRILYAVAGAITLIILLIVGSNILNYIVGSHNTKAIGELGQSTRQEMDKLRNELQQAREEAAIIRVSLSLPEKVVNNYGRGVCLIYGTYTFVDPRVGREVRFKDPTAMENPIGPDGNVNLSVDGNGRVYEVEFTGTGFLVDKETILTNRHVILAWEADELASIIKMRGFEPKLKELLAYFPQVRQPFTLRALEVSKNQDVALCSFAQGLTDLPVLPLDESEESIASGQPVVLIGYPAGLEGLVARVDEQGSAGARSYGNLSYRTQLNELAAHSKIRPQSTQGHISDIGPQLVYDARTDEGGSGGPVFGANGKVIGINQAVLLNSQATTNFGVPIRFGVELLKKHRQPIN